MSMLMELKPEAGFARADVGYALQELKRNGLLRNYSENGDCFKAPDPAPKAISNGCVGHSA